MKTMYTEDDTSEIFYGRHSDFDPDPVAEIEGDESRWSIWETRIYRHSTTGEHWRVELGRGKTEYQEDEVYGAPERVELREVKTDAETVTVTLPTGDGPLADWLDANGHKVAAQAVRGYVLEWKPVDQSSS